MLEVSYFICSKLVSSYVVNGLLWSHSSGELLGYSSPVSRCEHPTGNRMQVVTFCSVSHTVNF